MWVAAPTHPVGIITYFFAALGAAGGVCILAVAWFAALLPLSLGGGASPPWLP